MSALQWSIAAGKREVSTVRYGDVAQAGSIVSPSCSGHERAEPHELRPRSWGSARPQPGRRGVGYVLGLPKLACFCRGARAPHETDAEDMRAVRRRRAVSGAVLTLADLLGQSDKLDRIAAAVLDGNVGCLAGGGPKSKQQGHAAPLGD